MDQTFQCSNCNSLNYIGQELCGGCGQKLYYSCPQCGYGVETTFINCQNCRTTLYWPTQQAKHLPIERNTFKEQKVNYRYYQTPQKSRTNPFLFLGLSFAVMAILLGGAIFALNILSEDTLPATSTPVEAMSPTGSIPPADSSSNIATKTPKLTDIGITSVTDSSAVVTWTTDEPATSQVEYGTTNNYGSVTTLDNELVTNHSITINNLEPGTTYHFRAKSTNASGNEASFDASKTIITQTKVDTSPPVISAINVSYISPSGCTITWTTDKPATSQVEYGTTTAYGSSTSINNELVTNHSITLTGLQQSTIYHFKTKNKDANGNESSSNIDKTFRTPAAPPPSGGGTPSCCS
jgi:hypothetical protein